MSAAPRLDLCDLRIQQGHRDVAHVERLTVETGETLALLGPNGAGKTSLLLAIAGLLRPAEGAIFLNGRDIYHDPLAARRRMAMAFQEPLLLDRSVRGNLELGLRLRGIAAVDRRERALTWLKRFGVSGLAERHAKTLSGGEARRVSLARAFALDPQLLLLDEPLASIDEPSKLAILDDLQRELEATKQTTILVTHGREEARRMATSVALLLDGRLVQHGATEAVFNHPVSIGAATFLGIENRLPARVLRFAEGLTEIDCLGLRLLARGNPGERAYACFPAEAVGLRPAVGDPATNEWLATVDRIRRDGPVLRVRLATPIEIEAILSPREVSALSLDPGALALALGGAGRDSPGLADVNPPGASPAPATRPRSHAKI